MVNEEAMKSIRMEKTMLAALVATFGTVAAVVTLLSQPGAELLAGCGVVVIVCAAGVVALIRRPLWQAELTVQGIQCREMSTGAVKHFHWAPYRFAYEMRTSRGDACLMITTGERTRHDLTQAYRRCVITGRCAMDGCVCVPGCADAEAIELLQSQGIRVNGEPVRLYLG